MHEMIHHNHLLETFKEISSMSTRSNHRPMISAFQHILDDINDQASKPKRNLFPPAQAQKEKPTNNEHHQPTKENIQKISSLDIASLKVKELKAELKKRDLAVSGLKKELQLRLKGAIQREIDSFNESQNKCNGINNDTKEKEEHVEAVLIDINENDTVDKAAKEITTEKFEINTASADEEILNQETKCNQGDENLETSSNDRMSVEIINEKLDSMEVKSEDSTTMEMEESENKPEAKKAEMSFDTTEETKEENESLTLIREKCEVSFDTTEETKNNEEKKLSKDVLNGKKLANNTKHNEDVSVTKEKKNAKSKLDAVHTTSVEYSNGLKNYKINMTDLTIPAFGSKKASDASTLASSSSSQAKQPFGKSYGSKSASSTSTATSSSSSQASSKFAAARKARLEEMRGQLQSKNMALSAASSKANMTSYKLNKLATIKPLGKPERIAKITAPVTESSKETRPLNQTKALEKKEEIKKRIQAQMREKVASQTLKYSTPKKPTRPQTPSRSKVQFQEEVSILYPNKLDPEEMSPMDTYEISEDDDVSDSDESCSSDDSSSKQKQYPAWSSKENVKAAIIKQITGPNKFDPDRIFGEVYTCNLEEIFNMQKSRYKKRRSSGNWTKDHVTLEEKIKYKKEMGYQIS